MYTKLSKVITRRHLVKIAGDYFADPITQAQAHMSEATLRKADHEGNTWRGVKEKDLDELNYYSDSMNKGSGKAIQLLNEATKGKFAPIRIMSAGVDAIDEMREAHPEYDAENIYFTNKKKWENIEKQEREEAEEAIRKRIRDYEASRKATTSIEDAASNIPTKDIKKLVSSYMEHGGQYGVQNAGALGLLGTGLLGLAGHRKLTRGRIL